MKTFSGPGYTKIIFNKFEFNYTWDILDFHKVFLLKIIDQTNILQFGLEKNYKRIDIILNREYDRKYG